MAGGRTKARGCQGQDEEAEHDDETCGDQGVDAMSAELDMLDDGDNDSQDILTPLMGPCVAIAGERWRGL